MVKKSLLLAVTAIILSGQPLLASETALPRPCALVLFKLGFTISHPEISPMEARSLPVRVAKNLWIWYGRKDDRDKVERTFDYLSDYDYIREKRFYDKLGVVRSFFSQEFDTRIYYTATGEPTADGTIPVVDPHSRGLYVYFHGSGTNKASGVNFSYKANKLAALGYSVLSFDLPYHADGSQDGAKYHNPETFYAMIRDMINKYRVAGMPVYLAGHSHGPEIAAEFVVRYPHEVNGMLGISPASFNDELNDWFSNKTARMTALWGPIVSNDPGASWAGIMAQDHLWKNPPGKVYDGVKRIDPQVVNPNLNVTWISGEWEEYVPGKLDERGLPTHEPRDYDMRAALLKLFPHSKVIIEPGVGHYIFEHKDANGHDVILRELLAMNGQSLFNEKELKESAKGANLADPQEFARRFYRDPFFEVFVTARYKGTQTVEEIVRNNDAELARKITGEYSRYVVPQREKALAENIKKTALWDPVFYYNHKNEIDSIDLKKPRPSDGLLNSYHDLLESLTPEERVARSAVPEDIFKIPEKQIPSYVLERMQQGQMSQKKVKDKPKQTTPDQPSAHQPEQNTSENNIQQAG